MPFSLPTSFYFIILFLPFGRSTSRPHTGWENTENTEQRPRGQPPTILFYRRQRVRWVKLYRKGHTAHESQSGPIQVMAPRESMLLDLGFLRERGKGFVSPDHKRTAVAVRRPCVLTESKFICIHSSFPFYALDWPGNTELSHGRVRRTQHLVSTD